MSRTVKCVKLGKEAEGLERQMYPGELGKRIFENVSKEAWQMWLGQQTILINENRLSPIDPKHREQVRRLPLAERLVHDPQLRAAWTLER